MFVRSVVVKIVSHVGHVKFLILKCFCSVFVSDRLVLLRNEFQTSLWRMWNRNAYEHVFGTYYILWEVGGAFDKDTCKMDVLPTPPSLMFLSFFDIVFWTISRKTVNLLFSLNYSYGTLLVVPRNQLCSLMIYFQIIWQRKFLVIFCNYF